MVGVAPTNPTVGSKGPITLGAADAATGTTATLTRGVKGAFLALTNTASLIGRIAFQVPATMLAVTPPSAAAAQNAAAVQNALQSSYATQTAMANLGGQLFAGLAPMLAGLFGGDKQGGGPNKASVASADGGGGNSCRNGKCGQQQASADWQEANARPNV